MTPPLLLLPLMLLVVKVLLLLLFFIVARTDMALGVPARVLPTLRALLTNIFLNWELQEGETRIESVSHTFRFTTTDSTSSCSFRLTPGGLQVPSSRAGGILA